VTELPPASTAALPPASTAAATGPRDDRVTARSRSARASKLRRKSTKISTISDLLESAYARPRSWLTITPNARKALASDTTQLSALIEQITRLASSDPLLAVPPKLLLSIERAQIGGLLRDTLLGLVTVALENHPGLASTDLAAALSEETARDRDELIGSLQDTLRRLRPGDLGKESFRPAERRALHNNAILSVALLLALKHNWPADTLADCLDAHISRENLAVSERVVLADSVSPTALAITRAWREKLTEQTSKTRSAEDEAREAHRRWQEAVSRADAQVLAREHAEKMLAQRDEVIAGLERDLVSEREQRRIDKSHAIDDYETLRAQIVRGLAQQTSLLEDGLHALRNDRLAVTEEYVERAIDSLGEDLQRLRDDVKRDRGT
jgi:hypothetical protein